MSRVDVFYRYDDEGTFTKMPSAKLYEHYTDIYPFNWYAPELFGKERLEYYIKAGDGENVVRTEVYQV